MRLPVVNAVWIGAVLGDMHAACLSSFVTAGHRVILHVYGAPPSDLPRGIETADASVLLPLERLARHKKTGSYSLGSNFFRYEVLAAGLGLYVDCDVYCLKPIEDEDYIFGLEGAHEINGAVLKLPSDSPMLSDLRAIGRAKPFIPPWLPSRARRRLRLRSLLGRAPDIAEMEWGTAGPIALTYFAKKHGVAHLAKMPDAFYPLHYSRAYLLLDGALTLADIVTPRTIAVHLYNQAIGWRDGTMEDGSPLHEIVQTLRPSPEFQTHSAFMPNQP